MDEFMENLKLPFFCLYNISRNKLLKMQTISKRSKSRECFLVF